MTKTDTVIGDIYDAWRAQDVEWLASYLPEDFHHIIHIPPEMHPLGGTRLGKRATIERLKMLTVQFDFLRFDTQDLMIQRNRAGLEIPVRYRHRETGRYLETTIANFWTFEDGWPVKLVEYHDLTRIQSFVNEMIGPAGHAGSA